MGIMIKYSNVSALNRIAHLTLDCHRKSVSKEVTRKEKHYWLSRREGLIEAAKWIVMEQRETATQSVVEMVGDLEIEMLLADLIIGE